MWTPSSKENLDDDTPDYWFRLQYDVETARFEDISQILLNPIDDCSSCRICKNLQRKLDLEVPKLVEDGILWRGEKYRIGDAVFLEPDTYKVENSIKKGFRVPKQKRVDEEKYPEYYRKWLQVTNLFFFHFLLLIQTTINGC